MILQPMARPPRFRTNLLEDLFRQTCFAPAETRRRQMLAAEKLLRDLEPDRLYPEDFIVYRITAFRRSSTDVAQFVGAGLIADLAVLIERLSATMRLTADDFDRVPLAPAQASAVLGVSAMTLHRLRRKGLVAHMIRGHDGVARIVIFEDALHWFIATGRHRPENKAKGRHLNRQERERILRQARRYRRWAGRTLHQTSQAIARQTRRTAASVTTVIQRHDRRNPAAAIFPEHHALTPREVRLVGRARHFAVPVAEIARRLHRTRNTIYRLMNETKALRLRKYRVRFVALPTFAMAGAGEIILAPDCVTGPNLESLPFCGESHAWRSAVQDAGHLPEEDATAMIAAMNYLRFRACGIISRLPRSAPSAARVDEAETSLRWSTFVKQRLVQLMLHPLLTTLEQHLGCLLTDRPAEEQILLHQSAMRLLADSIDEFDPTRMQRLSTFYTFQLRRELAKRVLAPHPPESGGSLPQTVMLSSGAAIFDPWQQDLMLDHAVRDLVKRLSEPQRTILLRRHGLDGMAPATLTAVAAELQMTRSAAGFHEERGLRALRVMTRQSAASALSSTSEAGSGR